MRELRAKVTCDRSGCTAEVVGPTHRESDASELARFLGWWSPRRFRAGYVDLCLAHKGESA